MGGARLPQKCARELRVFACTLVIGRAQRARTSELNGNFVCMYVCMFIGRAQRARTSELNADSVCMYVYWASAASPY